MSGGFRRYGVDCSEGDLLDGAGDQAPGCCFGQDGPEEIVELGQNPALEATLQVSDESIEASEAENRRPASSARRAGPIPAEAFLGPFFSLIMASAISSQNSRAGVRRRYTSSSAAYLRQRVSTWRRREAKVSPELDKINSPDVCGQIGRLGVGNRVGCRVGNRVGNRVGYRDGRKVCNCIS